MSEFEIKEAFSVGFGNVSLEEMADVGYSMESAMIKAVAQYALDANDEINRLFAESVSSNQQRLEPDWTPINELNHVTKMPFGFYELQKSEDDLDCDILRKRNKTDLIYSIMSSDGSITYYPPNFIYENYTAYKLIRAFEPAAPSIPEGAVLNTLENRLDVDNGWYYFQGSGHALYRKTDPRWWVNHLSGQCINSDSLNFKDFTYFTKTTELDILAALEALAKGKR